tara:strand:+ start:353 stop:1381 length:1029 start_codon:yes stop_codon:yes gene_type:complete
LLAIVSDKKKGPIKEPCVAHIGYFNVSDPTKFIPVGETTTWCWQLGARLMWYGNKNNLIIYNKQFKNRYGSVIQRIDDKKIIKELKSPIYDVDKNAEFGLTLNFSRLGRLRPGYGYINFQDGTVGQAYPPDDGIWICDLKRNTKKLIIDLESVVNFEFDNNMLDTEHYINHLSFNPSGNRFLFFHVWNNNGKRRTRAITSDLNGENWFQLNIDKPSHYAWITDNELLMTGHGCNGFGYYLCNDQTDSVRPVGDSFLDEDGHPSYLKGEHIITDTYPKGLFNEQELLIYNLNENLNVIAKIHSSFFNQGEYKCDLHPRVNADYSKVAVDFCSQDRRNICVINL